MDSSRVRAQGSKVHGLLGQGRVTSRHSERSSASLSSGVGLSGATDDGQVLPVSQKDQLKDVREARRE